MTKLISFAIPSPLPGMGGWGNGYVAIPKDHPCFGMSYDDIHDKYNIRVHGNLTFSDTSDHVKPNSFPKSVKEMWIIGFDTLHYNDDYEKWPDEASIIAEAEKLKKQLIFIQHA